MATYIDLAGPPAPGLMSRPRRTMHVLSRVPSSPAPGADVVTSRVLWSAGHRERAADRLGGGVSGRVARLSADDVAGVRFPVTTFREGYRQREVDAFLACAAVSLRERASGRTGSVSADDVVVVAFPPSRILPGYDQAEVDDFLDHLVEAFA